MGFLCCNIIGTPHPLALDTHSRSISYIYNVFQHLLLWLLVLSMQPQPDICTRRVVKHLSRRFCWFLTWVSSVAPHPLRTHSRSISYIYNVFQPLLLWLLVIRMQAQPDICTRRVVKCQLVIRRVGSHMRLRDETSGWDHLRSISSCDPPSRDIPGSLRT